MRVVVVGASVAGVAACVELRRAGFEGAIELMGDEPHVPYDRPPLSKAVLTDPFSGPAEIALPHASELADSQIGLNLGRRATHLDLDRRVVATGDGTEVGFDGLVIATGAEARRLPGQPAAAGVHVLRTLDDALLLRRELGSARRVAVVGAGFIGLEVAASARRLGLETAVVEGAPAPLARVLGPDVGSRFAALHADHGVDLRCGIDVAGLRLDDGRVAGVELADGALIEADTVVVGIGAAPATDWLAGSGLELRDGVVCDPTLCAAPRVFAAGDVARWTHPLFGSIRVEHWTNAGSHARVAGSNLAASLAGNSETRVADEVPYFWSDQFGVKIQMAGWAAGYDHVEELDDGRRCAILFGREGRLVGAMTWNWPALLAGQRRAIAAATEWDRAREDLSATPLR